MSSIPSPTLRPAVALPPMPDEDEASRLVQRYIFATNKLRDGGYGEKGPVAAVYFKHLPFVQKNPQFMDMLEASWDEIAYAPEPENITEDYLEGED